MIYRNDRHFSQVRNTFEKWVVMYAICVIITINHWYRI